MATTTGRGADNYIQVIGCSKRYQRQSDDSEFWALRDVSLGIRRNEFLTILGPSGCGKTTLLKMIAGLIAYDDGAIKVDGVPVIGTGRQTAFVFQNFALLPWATVLQNVAFGLKLHKAPKATQLNRARDALRRVGLIDFVAYYPHELSGGMQQRVGLARALAVDTPILLMDEPFGALDAQTRRLMQEDLAQLLAHQSKTVVFVTHSIEEAIALSHRIAVMAPAPGRVLDVLTVPRSPEISEQTLHTERDALAQQLWEMLRGLQLTPQPLGRVSLSAT